jgi:zinc protease
MIHSTATSWSSLPGPENITRTILPNGIIVLSRSNFASPSVVLQGYLGSGSLFDPEEKLGLAYFTSQMLMRGTKKNRVQSIFNRLETCGASLGFSATMHTTSFGSRSLVEDLPMVVDLLAECILFPKFPLFQIEMIRAQLLTGLSLRAQDTEEMANLAFDEILFKGHPYQYPEDGFPETVRRIKSRDLEIFHQETYGPRGMVVVIVGAVESQQAIDLVAKAFANWRNPNQKEKSILPRIEKLKKAVRRHILIAEKSQTDLIIGTLGPKRSAEDYFLASIGNNVLGQLGMMGRIGEIVREQSGLAYHASANLSAGIDVGTWEVSAGVNPANVDKAIDLILKELKRFTSTPITKEELQDSQSSFIGRLPLSLESNAGVAGALLSMERFQLGLDYFQKYTSRINAVTIEQVLETAKNYIDPDTMAIISAGSDGGKK